METESNNTLKEAKEELKEAATLATHAAQKAVDVVKHEAGHAREVAATRFEQAREYAAAKVSQARQVAGAQVSQWRDYASQKATVVRQKAGEGWDDTCDKAKQLHHSGEEYVKANPTKSVLIALGVGFVLGALIRRR